MSKGYFHKVSNFVHQLEGGTAYVCVCVCVAHYKFSLFLLWKRFKINGNSAFNAFLIKRHGTYDSNIFHDGKYGENYKLSDGNLWVWKVNWRRRYRAQLDIKFCMCRCCCCGIVICAENNSPPMAYMLFDPICNQFCQCRAKAHRPLFPAEQWHIHSKTNDVHCCIEWKQR